MKGSSGVEREKTWHLNLHGSSSRRCSKMEKLRVAAMADDIEGGDENGTETFTGRVLRLKKERG